MAMGSVFEQTADSVVQISVWLQQALWVRVSSEKSHPTVFDHTQLALRWVLPA